MLSGVNNEFADECMMTVNDDGDVMTANDDIDGYHGLFSRFGLLTNQKGK